MAQPTQLGGVSLLPRLFGYIVCPAPLLSSARFARIHNQAAKAAMRTVLRNHHRRRIPGHFRADARWKYDYKPRTGRTNQLKREKTGQAIDLVKSSRTRQRMTRIIDSIRISGSAAKSGAITGWMQLAFPFPVRSRNADDPRTVTMADMMKEIEAWTPHEQEVAAQEFVDEYNKELFALLNSSPKMRTAYRAARAAAGA